MTIRELQRLSDLLGKLYEEFVDEFSADQQYAIHRARDIAQHLLRAEPMKSNKEGE